MALVQDFVHPQILGQPVPKVLIVWAGLFVFFCLGLVPLVGWSLGRWVGWLVGRWVGGSVGGWVGRSVGQLVGQLVC